ncbi:MAG TPA: SdrD B-like domain-containing protein, partial [Chloroflexota bacterium]|nr:SdrD B-like domain-containing protein [Chloroflexota bacterium]
NNGQWDSGEPGLPDWVIELEGVTTTLTTTTNASGHYWFMGITTGTYTITEQLQPGWTQTYPPSGDWVVSYVPSQAIENLDFGNYVQPGEIHGQKFHDLDGDGVKDSGEPGLPNWMIL